MPSKRQHVRRFVALLLSVYVAWLIFGYQYHFLDGVNLLIHEAGHFIFGAAPETMSVAGGTILQLAFPVLFAWYFWRRSSVFEGAVVGVWAAESLMYTGRYMQDARAQELPLIGGHLHDWNYLLGQAGMLDQAEVLGTGVHVLASLLAIVCLWVMWKEA